ncbi:hypothetical protein C4E24_00935 [ANME-1 cluster archaeon AG-394-G21]|nr:hypothetical protein [ANME-1 cluster archaeon AG-394-G21]
MRSFERVFNKIKQENPLWSDYICFAATVKTRKFSRQTIAWYFNRLVDKDEYDQKDKKTLLKQLSELSQGDKKVPEDNQFQG